MITNTPYDDVFRTISNDCRQLVIPLINEMFDQQYGMDEEITFLQNEHFLRKQDAEEDKIITDSCILIRDKKYHIECQSTPDGSMAIRMFEYDSEIALERGVLKEHVLEITYPESGVLYLRSTQSTPDQIKMILHFPGDEATYYIPIMKMKDYSLEDILQKELYFLIPFYLFTFEHRFDKIEEDNEQLKLLMQEYSFIVEKLDELVEAGRLNEFTQISLMEMTRKVAENLAVKHEGIKKGVEAIMGGKILNYPAKDILNDGIQLGRQEGRQEGAMWCYLNAVSRGMSQEDARAIAGISEADAKKAIRLRKEGKI